MQEEAHAGKFPSSFFSNKKPIVQSTFTMSREVMEFLTLLPGEYLIVPSTLKPNETASFLLTIFSREETQC